MPFYNIHGIISDEQTGIVFFLSRCVIFTILSFSHYILVFRITRICIYGYGLTERSVTFLIFVLTTRPYFGGP